LGTKCALSKLSLHN